MSSKAAIITGSAIVGGAAAWVWLDHGGKVRSARHVGRTIADNCLS